MKRSALPPLVPEAKRGFSLLEAMVALAIASIILAAIATLGSQVLRNWMRGQETLAALEMLQRGLGRLETDLSLALPMPLPGSDSKEILFKGDEQTLMFPAATGFGAGNRGLELLSISVTPEQNGSALVRKRGPIANLGTVLADPVILLRGRMTLSFSYRDSAGLLSRGWENQADMPAAVLVDVKGASGTSLFPAAIVIPILTNLSVACLSAPGRGKGKADTEDAEDADADKASDIKERCGTETASRTSNSDNDDQDDGQNDGKSEGTNGAGQ